MEKKERKKERKEKKSEALGLSETTYEIQRIFILQF